MLVRDVCLMPRTEFGSDIMLNISIEMQRDVLYHVVYARVDAEEEA